MNFFVWRKLFHEQSQVLTTLKKQALRKIVGKGENTGNQIFPPNILYTFSYNIFHSRRWICRLQILRRPFPKRHILDSSKVKEFADHSPKFDENDRKFSKRVENTVGKVRNCSLRAISPFPTVFSKDSPSRHVKTRNICVGNAG